MKHALNQWHTEEASETISGVRKPYGIRGAPGLGEEDPMRFRRRILDDLPPGGLSVSHRHGVQRLVACPPYL